MNIKEGQLYYRYVGKKQKSCIVYVQTYTKEKSVFIYLIKINTIEIKKYSRFDSNSYLKAQQEGRSARIEMIKSIFIW